MIEYRYLVGIKKQDGKAGLWAKRSVLWKIPSGRFYGTAMFVHNKD